MRNRVRAVTRERERLLAGMDGIGGVEAFPSEANFIMFRVRDPKRIYKGLLRRGVLVRDVSGMVRGCLRVTVGTKKDNNAFLKALKETI